MNPRVIEVSAPTVLHVGGCRVTLEPLVAEREVMPRNQSAAANCPPNPAQWRIAEKELRSKCNMPFEIPSICKAERLELAPRVGGKYRSNLGNEVEIAQIVTRHGPFWFVFDVNRRPVVLKRIDMRWHALPRDNIVPSPGEKIVHNGTESSVVQVLGEAELGGWVVMNGGESPIHVIRSEGHVWVSLGAVEVEP